MAFDLSNVNPITEFIIFSKKGNPFRRFAHAEQIKLFLRNSTNIYVFQVSVNANKNQICNIQKKDS